MDERPVAPCPEQDRARIARDRDLWTFVTWMLGVPAALVLALGILGVRSPAVPARSQDTAFGLDGILAGLVLHLVAAAFAALRKGRTAAWCWLGLGGPFGLIAFSFVSTACAHCRRLQPSAFRECPDCRAPL